MSSESFPQMMARLRARDQDLDDRLATLGKELHEYARDHRELIAAVDADQITAPVPQYSMAEALNTFGSAQVVAGAAPDSDTDMQMANDDGTVFLPDEAPMDDEPESARPTPRRRVTFAESDVIIAGTASHRASDAEHQEHVAESIEVEMPSDDAHISYDRPEAAGMSDTSIDTFCLSKMLTPFLPQPTLLYFPPTSLPQTLRTSPAPSTVPSAPVGLSSQCKRESTKISAPEPKRSTPTTCALTLSAATCTSAHSVLRDTSDVIILTGQSSKIKSSAPTVSEMEVPSGETRAEFL
jgi:hypothetical protein